jgi:hypothetical protein
MRAASQFVLLPSQLQHATHQVGYRLKASYNGSNNSLPILGQRKWSRRPFCWRDTSNRTNIQLLDLARENSVHTVYLPPHCTYKLHFPDVSFMLPFKTYCHDFVCDYSRGFGLVSRFIHHLYIRLGITNNCSATANLHNSPHQPLSLFQPPIFTSRSLATASNSGDSQLHALKSSLHRLPYRTD